MLFMNFRDHLPYSRSHNSIHYLDINPNGTPNVLLLHGLGADASSWAYQFPTLIQNGYRTIAFDIPGFGESKYLGNGWNIKEASRKIAEVIISERLHPAHIAGISLGGALALQLAIDYPNLLNKLILINTMANLRPKKVGDLYYLIKRFLIANIKGVNAQAEIVAFRLFQKPDQEFLRKELIERIKNSDPRIYRSAMVSLGLFDVRRKIEKIRVTTLVISGENDSTVPIELQKDLADRIPGARHEIIENSGHAVIVDQPEKFNKIFLEFLKS
jgi:3-oxoadipate enol-lactonase